MRGRRAASRKLPTANPHQCSVTIVRSKFIIPVRSGGRCAGAAAGGGRRSPCASPHMAAGAGAGRGAGLANALRGIRYPVHPAAYRVRTQYSGQKNESNTPGARGKTLVKALEPPPPPPPPRAPPPSTPQHPSPDCLTQSRPRSTGQKATGTGGIAQCILGENDLTSDN